MKKTFLIQALLLFLASSAAPAVTFAAQDSLPQESDGTLVKVLSIAAVGKGVHSVTVQELPLHMGATYLFPEGKGTVFLIGGDPEMVKECLKSKKTGTRLLLRVVQVNNAMGLSVAGKKPAEIYKAVVATTEFD